MLEIQIKKKSPTKGFEGLVNYAQALVEAETYSLDEVYELLAEWHKNNRLNGSCHISSYTGLSGKRFIGLQYGHDGGVNAYICEKEIKEVKPKPLSLLDIVGLVLVEAEQATIKHPDWPVDIIHATAIVSEESGELVRAALNYEYEGSSIEEIKKEAIQTAATCFRLIYNLPIN